jgi:hypothetical protein
MLNTDKMLGLNLVIWGTFYDLVHHQEEVHIREEDYKSNNRLIDKLMILQMYLLLLY